MTTQDLRQLLEAHVEDVAELDFADRAWAAALGRQHRRRTVLGAGLAAGVAAAVAVATVPGRGGAGVTTPATGTTSTGTSSSPTTSADPRAAFFGTDGTPYVLGGDQATLRDSEVVAKFPMDLRIPARPRALEADLAARGTDSSDVMLLAVAARQVGSTSQPLLYLTGTPAGSEGWVSVDLPLDPVDPVNGTSGIQPGAIAPDGHTLVFVQPRELVVLDARTAEVRRVAIGDDPRLAPVTLEGGGFADDGSYVTWGSGAAFVLPKGANALTRAADGARPEAWTIESDASGTDGRATLVRRGPEHVTVGSRIVETHFEAFGPSAYGAAWVAQGGFPDSRYLPSGEERLSGLLAVSQDGARRKVLVMDEAKDGDMKGGLTAVAFLDWTEHPTVVFRYYSPRGDSLGAWDLETDAISFVSRLDDPTDDESRPRVVAVSTRTSWVS